MIPKLGRKTIAGAIAVIAAAVLGSAVWAALPTTPDPPCAHDFSVPVCVLAGGTPMDAESVSAFTRSIRQDHGTNVVITQNTFADGQSTGWHDHPGPNIVVILSGGLKLYDDKCRETDYAAGEGFATGLEVHKAVAVGVTKLYSVYFMPKDADVLRTPATAADTSLTPSCAA